MKRGCRRMKYLASLEMKRLQHEAKRSLWQCTKRVYQSHILKISFHIAISVFLDSSSPLLQSVVMCFNIDSICFTSFFYCHLPVWDELTIVIDSN
ncbi:MAG: hypothetical protein ACYCWE_21945 [Eubacteriales bacterium]